jgi:CIC family chloride channel protein
MNRPLQHARDIARRILFNDKTMLVFIIAGVIGCAGALLIFLFRLSFLDIRHFFDPQAVGMVDLAEDLPWWGRLLLPVAGGALAGALLEYGLHWTPKFGSDDYLEAITIGDGNLSVRQTLIKSLASLCSISSGASIGREGPMVQLAAMAGSSLGRLLKLPADKLRLLVACGATAGLAAAYNAPIAGLLFIVEIAFGSLSKKTLAPMIVSAVIAVVVTHHFFGISPVYQIPRLSLATDSEILAYVGLGIVCGFVAPAFRCLLDISRKAFGRIGRSRLWTMALGGLGVGLISVWNPGVWGNGYSVVNSILHLDWTWKALLLILLLKILATSISYGSGAIGGVFTPTIFVGAALGALYGHVFHHGNLAQNASIVTFAVVGMGAFLSSITYAPLMSILMIYELTLSYEIVLPLMLACVISHHIAQSIREDSIYDRKECGLLADGEDKQKACRICV